MTEYERIQKDCQHLYNAMEPKLLGVGYRARCIRCGKIVFIDLSKRAKNTEQPTSEEEPTMCEIMQPPEPVIPEYNQHDRAVSESRIVWMDKDEATKLYACRAALVDCLDQMARTPKSAVSPDFIAAIDDGRKALGES